MRCSFKQIPLKDFILAVQKYGYSFEVSHYSHDCFYGWAPVHCSPFGPNIKTGRLSVRSIDRALKILESYAS